MYELLIGELPFIIHADPASTDKSVSVDDSVALDCAAASLDGSASSDGSLSMDGLAWIKVPESVLPRDRVQWAKYQAMLQAQQSWVSAQACTLIVAVSLSCVKAQLGIIV